MSTKTVIKSKNKREICELTEIEKMALFQDGDIDLDIEFLKFIKDLRAKKIIKRGWIGIDILPKSESNKVNSLWDEHILKQRKKEGKQSKKEWNKLINTKDKIVIVKRKPKPKEKEYREMVGIPPRSKVVNHIGYCFYYPELKQVQLIIKDVKTSKAIARKSIPMPKKNIPFVPLEGSYEWFEENGGIDVLHFM